MHSLCSSSPTKLRPPAKDVEEEELGDQLGLERARVRQIADRSAVEHATGHRTTVGDPRNSNAFEL